MAVTEVLVTVDDTVLKAKIADLQAKVADLQAKVTLLEGKQMPDNVKLKLKDVLTWIIANL